MQDIVCAVDIAQSRKGACFVILDMLSVFYLLRVFSIFAWYTFHRFVLFILTDSKNNQDRRKLFWVGITSVDLFTGCFTFTPWIWLKTPYFYTSRSFSVVCPGRSEARITKPYPACSRQAHPNLLRPHSTFGYILPEEKEKRNLVFERKKVSSCSF